jgi:flagellar biosynthesis protein FlhA
LTVYVYTRRAPAATEPTATEAAQSASDPYAVFSSHPIEVELGSQLAQLVGGAQGTLSERMAAFRQQYAQEIGLVIPVVHFRENSLLPAEDYRISMFGDSVASARVQVKRTLAIHPAGDLSLIEGTETREPTYGLPALWIDDSQREAARKARYTRVDPVTVVFTHWCEMVRGHCAELLTRAELERMLARVRETQPGLVEELIPTQLTLSDVQKVFQNLLREKVPVRNLQGIVEALLDGVRASKDPAVLTELVRQRLSMSICNSLSVDKKSLQILSLDPQVEEGLMAATATAGSPGRRGDSRLLDSVLTRLASATDRMIKENITPIVLCTPELRRALRTLCSRATPHLRVISFAEVAAGFELRSFASISVPTSTSSKTSTKEEGAVRLAS